MFETTTLQAPIAADEYGVVRVAGTRVTLLSLLNEYDTGASPEAIAEAFPSVSLADVYATIAWYLAHRAEMDTYLADERTHVKSAHLAGQRIGLRERLQAQQTHRD